MRCDSRILTLGALGALLQFHDNAGLLALFGATRGGWAVAAVLLFDWLALVLHGAWCLFRRDYLRRDYLPGGGKFEWTAVFALVGIPATMMFTQSFPFTHILLGDKELKPFFKSHWLVKAGEAIFLVPNAVQLIALDSTEEGASVVTSTVALISLVAFVLQFPFLFYVLKWAQNATAYPVLSPSDVYVFPCAGGGRSRHCCNERDGSTGGIECVADMLIDRIEDNDRTLAVVKFSKGMATPDRVARLGAALKRNTSVARLDLSGGAIDTEAKMRALAEGLRANDSVYRLDLSGSHRAGAACWKALAVALSNSTLAELDVSDGSIADDAEMTALASGFAGSNASVVRLDLRGCSAVGVPGWRALAGALKNNRSLTDLNLQGCAYSMQDGRVNREPAQAFRDALKVNTTLSNVTLDAQDFRLSVQSSTPRGRGSTMPSSLTNC